MLSATSSKPRAPLFTLLGSKLGGHGPVVALVLGGLFGLLHGALIASGRIAPFIVTLVTLGIYRSVLTWLADGGAVTLDNGIADSYGPVYYGSFLSISCPVWIFVLVALGAS